jgi:hypothetical protein
MQNYKIDILTYHSDNSVRSDCADITFQNTGTSDVIINNGFTLPPNTILSITANENEIDRTIYTFYFQGTSPNNLIVLRKVYI